MLQTQMYCIHKSITKKKKKHLNSESEHIAAATEHGELAIALVDSESETYYPFVSLDTFLGFNLIYGFILDRKSVV